MCANHRVDMAHTTSGKVLVEGACDFMSHCHANREEEEMLWAAKLGTVQRQPVAPPAASCCQFSCDCSYGPCLLLRGCGSGTLTDPGKPHAAGLSVPSSKESSQAWETAVTPDQVLVLTSRTFC